jgi:hypothetical protein
VCVCVCVCVGCGWSGWGANVDLVCVSKESNARNQPTTSHSRTETYTRDELDGFDAAAVEGDHGCPPAIVVLSVRLAAILDDVDGGLASIQRVLDHQVKAVLAVLCLFQCTHVDLFVGLFARVREPQLTGASEHGRRTSESERESERQ